MAKITLDDTYLDELAAIDAEVKQLTDRKLLVLFEALTITAKPQDLEKILQWELIAIAVPDRGIAKQLNGLLANVPNVIFEVSTEKEPFSLSPGITKRRVRKDRQKKEA